MATSGRLVIKWWVSESGRQAALTIMRRTWPESGEDELAAKLDSLPQSLPLDLDVGKAEALLKQLADKGLTAEYWLTDEDLPVRLTSRPRLEVAEALTPREGTSPPPAETHHRMSVARLVVFVLVLGLVLAAGLFALPRLAGWLATAP